MTWKVADSVQEKLDSFDATYRIIAQARQSSFKVEIIDKITKQVFGEGEGATEPEALVDAVNKIDPDRKPKTPAQLAAENAALRQRLAALENPEIKTEGKPTKKNPASQPSNPVGKKVDVQDGDK